MEEILLVLAGLAILLLIGTFKLAIRGIRALFRHLYSLTADGRQNKVEDEQLEAAKSEFERVWKDDAIPSEALLTRLEHCIDRPMTVNYFHINGDSSYSYAGAVRSFRTIQRKRQQLEEERKSTVAEHWEVFSSFEAFIATCANPWSELMRTAAAFGGGKPDFIKTVKYDVLQILNSIWGSNGGSGSSSIPHSMGRICQAAFANLEPNEFVTVNDCIGSILGIASKPVSVPVAVKLLSSYEKIMKQSASFDAIAASAYRSLVITASACCPCSRPVEVVKDYYLDLLSPYIHESGGNGQAGRSTSSAGSKSSTKPVCEKCVKGYQLLGLPFGASEAEVRQKRRAWAEVLHPDQLGNKSQGARGAAEEQLKAVNAACDHILECRLSGAAS